jgi:class 3 adenylate cyclase
MAVRFITSAGLAGTVVVLYFLGPLAQFDAAYIAVGLSFLPLYLVRKQAIVPVCVAAIGYGVLMATEGYPSPVSRWIVVIGLGVSAAILFEWVMNRVRDLSRQERLAHLRLEEAHSQLEAAHDELANLNMTLEARVAAQVADIESLNRMRRFLSPQVAEAVLSAGDEHVLEPHRRQIAVFFCDLRGFTGFAAGTEPEVVVEALDDYYEIVGKALRDYDATVGTFAGDGIMAYLNDPVPCADPAWTAVQMARDLSDSMTTLVTTWAGKGFDLSYGIGIAYGFAMLGTIGFEGRYDYTALGSVVNLASRLCGEAGSGEVLIDAKTADALARRIAVAEREVSLKGFPSTTTAFQIVG